MAEPMKYPITPIAKPRMTHSDKWKQRPCVMAYRAYKDRLRELEFYFTPNDRIIFHIPMPQSWSKKKKAEHNGQPHQSKPDLDNLLKAIMDAIYKDDSHIWKLDAEKRWAYMPSIEVKS